MLSISSDRVSDWTVARVGGFKPSLTIVDGIGGGGGAIGGGGGGGGGAAIGA